ncbi:unnamed protein product [Closterium sp. NIES-54]
MASLPILAFDHEGRPVQFDTWLDDLQLYLLSDSKDTVSLFDLASGATTAPPATADSLTRSQWLTRDAAARLAIHNHLPLAECAHFEQHRTAQAQYDAVVARYSSPATAALGRLLLPYLFPELSAFTTVEDLVSHLRASDARYRAAVPTEFLDRNPPWMFITLYFIVTRLPDSLRSVKDHFFSLDLTSLTVDLPKKHLLVAETSAVAVGAARGTPRPPFFEGCSPSPLAPSSASAAAADVSIPEDVGAASASAKRRSGKGKGGRGGGGGSGGGGGGSGSGGGGSSGGGGGGATVGGSGGSGGGGGGSGGSGGSGGGGTGSGGTGARPVGSRGGQRQQQQRRGETPSPQQLREWFLRGASGGSCPYLIRMGDRAGQTCGWLHTQHRCFSRLDDAWRAEFGVNGAESGGAEPQGATSSGDSVGALPSLSAQHLREWFVRRTRLWRGASGAGGAGAAGGRGTGVAAGVGVTRGTATAGPGCARTQGTEATGTGGIEGAGAGDLPESCTTGAGGAGTGGAGVGGPGAGGAGAGGPGVGGADAGGAGAVAPGGAMRPRPYFVPLLQQVLGTLPSADLPPPLLCPPPDRSLPPLQPASPLPAPSPYTEKSGGLTEHREPASCPVSPVRTACRIPRSHPPPVPGTHAMTLCPSSVPLRVPLPAPPESCLPEVPDPESDRACAASPTVSRLLATAVTDPSFESAAASALVAELLDFTAACRLDCASALVAKSASSSPPSVRGECALGMDVLEDRQEDFESLAAAVPCFASMLLAPEGDPDAAMDAEMASWKSTGTYVDEVPPPGANIVDGMWIFRVKRPPGSPPAFKPRYVARGFNQRQGVDYFHTFSPTPKMTTLRVLLHVAAQRDYELQSLDFSTAFPQGSLHEEIWLRRPPGFTESFPACTQWSLRRPVYGLRQAPRKWHDILRTTLAALRFAPATADPSLFLRTDTLLPLLYILVYVDDLVFATADTEALTLVKSELQKRHTCTYQGELRIYLGLQITWDRARRTITLTQSHMVHQVLQRFSFQYSSPQPTPVSTSHSLSAPPSDESVEPSGPYPELVGCLMVLRYLCSTSGMGLVLGGRGPVVLTGHADASWVDDSAT